MSIENNDPNKSLEDQIAEFLRNFQSNKPFVPSAAATPYSDSSPDSFAQLLHHLTLDSYREVWATAATDAKITALQSLITAIEQRAAIQENVVDLLRPDKVFAIDYQRSLNKEQYRAATTLQGAVLVIAGAGSGKTRTLTYRTAYMLENGIPPEQILLLTFTRKAAQEMVRRTTQLLGGTADSASITRGTFHAFANHSLRRYAPMLGLSPQFTILDVSDSEDVIDLIRSELKFVAREKAFPRKGRLQEIISQSRNWNQPISQVIAENYKGLTEFTTDIETLAAVYQRYKRQNQVMDYDDLMDNLRDQLRDNAPFRQKMQQTYRYIMVDEFQDTNLVQKQIVDLLAAEHGNIMVVGDDAQSIYAFRGANFENILTFPLAYPDCKIIKLEQNYRSNQDLLNFTNDIANSALLGYKKKLFSSHKNPGKPIVARFENQEAEAQFIVDKIMDLREKNIPLDDIAVLYRATYHGNYVQAELLKRNIPYVVVGGIKFVERRHIRDIIAILRLSLNPLDAVSWNRILKLFPGIGKVTISKIVAHIQENGGKIGFGSHEKKAYGAALLQLQKLLTQLQDPKIHPVRKIEMVRDYYAPICQAIEDDADIRMNDVEVLILLAAKYITLESFLADFMLEPPNNQFQNQVLPLIDESEERPVTLSTIHSAKGLEWYAVFAPHLLDGLLPTAHSLADVEKYEEERRLFYVACSRAKEQLYLTLPAYFQSWDNFYTLPSRFLIEVEEQLYTVLEPTSID